MTTNYRLGQWVAVEAPDGEICTGTVSRIEITRSGTHYTIELMADSQYRSKVGQP